MKKLFSCLIIVTTLFTTTLSNSCSAFFINSNNEIITLSQSQLDNMQEKLEKLDRQLNPTTRDKILRVINQTTKDSIYYGTLAVLATVAASKAGYVKLPKTFSELKSLNIDKNIGFYGLAGFLAGSFFGALGNLFGFSNLGFLTGPLTVGVLSMYKTGIDPISQSLNTVEKANNIASAVNSAADTVSGATDAVKNSFSNAYKWFSSLI